MVFKSGQESAAVDWTYVTIFNNTLGKKLPFLVLWLLSIAMSVYKMLYQ